MGRARHVIWSNQKSLYFSYSYTVKLTSILAAGIVQNTFAGEAGEGKRGRRSRDDWRLHLPTGPEILPVS